MCRWIGEPRVQILSRLEHRTWLQFRILRLGFFQYGDVGIGVLPQGKKIAVLFVTVLHITHQDFGTRKLESRQGSENAVLNNATVI